MAWRLDKIIFPIYGTWEKLNDAYKNAEGKGVSERFNELVAADYDDELNPLVANLVDNTLVPRLALERFVPYLEEMIGLPILVSDQMDLRRKLIGFATRLYQIRGTKRSYEVLLRLLGFDTVNIIEFFDEDNFDNPNLTLDDPNRKFDSGCRTCSDYAIELTGSFTVPFDTDLQAFLFNVIEFCEPINADLRYIEYNGNPIPLSIISVFIDDDGNLIYDNTNDPGITLALDANGFLIVSGVNANKYLIDFDGFLIYTS